MHGTEQHYIEGQRYLSCVDPIMKRLIQKHGPCRIHTLNQSLFHSLASAIIGQQLSVKAADTIQRRVMALTSNPMMPKRYLSADVEALRTAGLSRSKTQYIRNIATAIVEDGLSKQKLRYLDDDDVKKSLTAIKGIGAWTAEMYLMFGLKRLDVVSLGDLGLQRAARNLYNEGERKDGLLANISSRWKPYRTIACWYLWKSVD